MASPTGAPPPVDGDVALVLGAVDHGEASRVVRCLGPRGRFSVYAPGARASRRRFGGALEPFQTVRLTFAPSRGRGGALPNLAAATVLEPRLALRGDLARLALASYAVELMGRVAPEGEDTVTLLDLAVDLLDQLVRGPARPELRRAFEVRLLGELGYRPELGACVTCGAATGRAFLDLTRGGRLCELHRRDAREVGPRTLDWLEGVLGAVGLEPDGGLEGEGPGTAAAKVTAPVAAFYAQLLERPLRSVALLDELGL